MGASEDVSSMLREDKGILHGWWGLTSFELCNLNQVNIIRHAQSFQVQFFLSPRGGSRLLN